MRVWYSVPWEPLQPAKLEDSESSNSWSFIRILRSSRATLALSCWTSWELLCVGRVMFVMALDMAS